MSSRQLRKLQQQRELEKATESAARESEESEDAEELVASPKPRPNLFAALVGEDEADGDGDGDGKDDDEDDTVNDQGGRDVSQVPPPASSNKSKKRRQQKKKKKAKVPAGGADQGGEDEDEIDKAMKELKVDSRNNDSSSTHNAHNGSRSRMNELLSINTHHLRVVNEMRSLFGRDVMESANAEEQQEGGRRRRAPVQRQVDLETFLREPPGAAKLADVSLRRNVFVQGRDHWPRQSAGGLTMKEVEKAPDGSWTEYAYVHDKEYDSVQVLFFACVQTGDPMRMVHLLKRVPYHASTLLQVSSVAKQDQNMALSAELCERALFTFGRVTTSSFRQSMEQGRARLDFRRPENRQFWLAGYHYLKSLVRKGTYRTALEWAKLLYALDPKDPYAMRHYIHFLAIRARESRWLIDFMDEIDSFCDDRDLIYLRQSLVLARLQTGDVEGARGHLTHGIQRLPWLYCCMFQELNLDAPQSVWGVSSDPDSRSFWVRLYLYQTKELWDNAQATALLQDVARGLGRVDVAALPNDDAPADLGATRLAYLEGQTSLLAVAPRALLDSQPNYDFDPLPPPEPENIFTGEGTRLPWSDGQHQSQGQSAELLAQMRNLMAGQGGPAPPGALFHDDDNDDDEIRALRQADDEELQRDLEAHVGLADGPGLLGMVMQALGIGRDGARRPSDDVADADADDGNGLPGAWPAEDEEGARDGL
ncbi:transcriptional repressor TCF25 domain-containing protein [Hirsutella rhossiliensis]|uniref:Transcriptional repressor TCF25 domain-containing protein n=1 Tax=Hirsutella rhossiliensis TaxID=111463 RepID=A0A9P8SG46_9HYPO|nr:transcriptional repressor TCF25 domain-containing protein [Hirsutella rhossiliensis]KAH0960754.1 transcriptional repressor TCF25 domain-containing protein [Hirsutella rhossiliensis]